MNAHPRILNGGINIHNWHRSWRKYPSQTWNPTKYLQQTLFSGQLSFPDASDFCPGAEINPKRRGPRPNIYNRCWGSHDLHQVLIVFNVRHKGSPYFSNRRHGRLNYLQQTLWLPLILSTDARAFKLGVAAPPGRLKYWLPSFLW